MIWVFIINSLLIFLVVAIHYEVLSHLTALINRLDVKHHRFRIVAGIFGALCAHVVEIWLFALGYFLMEGRELFGSLTGNFTHTMLDCVYYSFTTYTSLGFGDIVPTGNLRFLTGLEALTGLVLITWTASFMFLEMQRFWRAER